MNTQATSTADATVYETITLDAESWAAVVWILDALAREHDLGAVSRRRAAILCDRIHRQRLHPAEVSGV